jgi:hypothetical protein
MQVVEHEHSRARGGETLEEASPGREQLLPLCRRRGFDPDERRQPLEQPLPLGLFGRDDRFQFCCGNVGGVGLEDPRLTLDDLAQRPEGDSLPVGQAATLPPRDQLGFCVDVGEELAREPALANTRLADDRDELNGALLRRALESPDQKRLLELASDKGRLVPTRGVPSEPVADRLRLPEQKRLAFSLDGDRRERLVLEHVTRRPVGLLADGDAVDGRDGLDAGSGVNDVPGYEPFAPLGTCADRDDRLAGVDAYPDLETEARIGLVELGDRFEDAQPGPHCAFGVVLVRYRSAADGHHCVTHELFDCAAVTLDLRPQACVVRTDPSADILWILLLGGGCESHQIAKEDGDDLSLLDQWCRLLGQRRRAIAAERKPFRVILAATRTNSHAAESV